MLIALCAAVGKEVLRMYPSMIHTRLLLVDIELPSSGKRIPKGMCGYCGPVKSVDCYPS
jgi:hypothetical protein